ncbi:MAG: hypothetical protein HKN68_00845 [Saprospiraceae bacterium]|nr:hypothetical protein [Saprospiraceae bacterium]
MNALINHLIHDINQDLMAHRQALDQVINNKITQADNLKTKMHKELSRPSISMWTFLMTILMANILVGI